METFWEAFKRQGVSRRDFLRFAFTITGLMGLSPSMFPEVVKALETKPRVPVLWLHGLECTCCSESFIRSATPLASDVLLSVISLEYDDTLSAAAGEAVENHKKEIIKKYWGNYILAVEGNPPLGEDGMYCAVAGEPFLKHLQEAAEGAKAIIAWGSCASWGCVQAAKPNPTTAVSIDKVIKNKPIIKVPGCPPIAEVMTGVIMHIAIFDSIPPLDAQGRPKQFYGNRIHDTCYRRAFFDAGQFVERFDDEGAKKGWCLYKVGCRGPTTYNSCGNMRWYNGLSYPIQAGHGCIGCSEENFWDNGPFYQRLTAIPVPNVEANADKVGVAVAAAATAGAIAHGVISTLRNKNNKGGE